MARTPKAVRRNGGGCVCPAEVRWACMRDGIYLEGTCKKGWCFSAKCCGCGGELFGVGPVACPCEHPRWTRYPGMEQPGHWDFDRDAFVPCRAAVKPSLARRRNRKPVRATS